MYLFLEFEMYVRTHAAHIQSGRQVLQHVDIEAHLLSCKRFNEKRNTTECLYAVHVLRLRFRSPFVPLFHNILW